MKILFLFFILLVSTATIHSQNQNITDVWVVFKTHFDLGFTDLPENVFERYREEMIDNALNVIESNSLNQPNKHFAWTISAWPLQAQILGPKQTSKRKARIEKAIKTGSLVFHALPFTTHTGSLEYEELVRGLEYSTQLSRKYDLPLSISAKMTDVPSHSWVLPTLLNHAGIKLLQLGCNPASQYPRVPELFWWEGPDGSKILCHYTSIYGSDIKPTANWAYKNYLAMQMTGDNHGPPTENDIKKLLEYAQNEMPGINIHFGTLDDFTKAILEENPNLPTVRGDMPDTWIHGLMSNPQGTKLARNIRPLIPVLEILNTQMGLWGIETISLSEKLSKAYEQSLLYGEHTWGMNAEYGPRYSYGVEWKQWITDAESEPIPPNHDYSKLKNSNSKNPNIGSKTKWLKSYEAHYQYIKNANAIVEPELKSHLNHLAKEVNISGKRFLVYNPLPWERSGIVEIPWDKGETFFVNNIPANGYKTVTENEIVKINNTTDIETSLSNNFFEVVFNLEKGGISSLIDKKTDRELIDHSSDYILGQFLHERFSSIEIDDWFNSYSRIKDGWGLNDLGKPGMPTADLVPYLAFTPNKWDISISHSNLSDIATLSSTSTEGFAKKYTIVFTFPKNEAYIDIEWKVDSKTPEKHPEGGWLCFPFALDNPIFTVGRLGGPINPATDIIKGTNRHLMAVNTGVTIVDSSNYGIGLAPMDSPLVSLGKPGLWKFSMDYVPKVSSIFVNLYNNMWNTNFQLWQEGSWSESVRIWSKQNNSSTIPNLIKNSWEARVPLLVGYADGEGGALNSTKQGILLSKEGVLITSFGPNPNGEGTVLRIWEQAGNTGELTIQLPEDSTYSEVITVNLRGEEIGDPIEISKNKFLVNLNSYAPASFILK